MQGCQLTRVPAEVEIQGRSAYAERLGEEGKTEEALAVLKEQLAIGVEGRAIVYFQLSDM